MCNKIFPYINVKMVVKNVYLKEMDKDLGNVWWNCLALSPFGWRDRKVEK